MDRQPFAILVFDDEPMEARALSDRVRAVTGWQAVLSTTSPQHVRQYLAQPHAPTLFYLDIMQGQQSPGLSLAADISTQPHNADCVVFITNYPEMVADNTLAQLDSSAFISKQAQTLSLDIGRTFQWALSRVCGRLVLTPRHGTNYYVDVQRVAYVCTIKRTGILAVHCVDGAVYETRATLREFRQKYNPLLAKVSRTHLAYLPNITKIDAASNTLWFAGAGGACPFSSHYYQPQREGEGD